jgi:hypothetical protein
MKPPSITDAYSNFGTEQRKNRGESREQAQYRMAKRYGIMAESWQQYIQPLLFLFITMFCTSNKYRLFVIS